MHIFTRRMSALGAAALFSAVAGASASAATPSPAPSISASGLPAAASPAAQPSPGAKAAMVSIYHYAYDPEILTVKPGTTVTFKNADEVGHTVTSVAGSPKPAFDSGDMPNGAAWTHTFAKPGTYKYYCQYHTYMKGTIVVK